MKKNQLINVQEILEQKGTSIKFAGCVPEGFVLLHEKTLEDLKDFDIWKNGKTMKYLLKPLTKLISRMKLLFRKKKKETTYSEKDNIFDESWEKFSDNISF